MSKRSHYKIKELFTYTGVSPIRIFFQLSKYVAHRIAGTRFVKAKVNNYRMKLDLDTPGLSKVLYVYGSRELLDIHVANELLTEGMVVADIGANIGYYSLLEAKAVGPSGHVYAFEPDPRNIPLLKENISLNNFNDRITVIEKAVSSKAEKKNFQLGERTNVSSFVDRPDVVGSVEVECIALHEYEHIEKIDMLRMDAEGYECKIIEGVMPYLEKTAKPFLIMLEVHPQEYNDTDLNFTKNVKDLFSAGFKTSFVIANAKARDFYIERGCQRVRTMQETKHVRDLYQDVSEKDTIAAIENNCVRSMVFSR